MVTGQILVDGTKYDQEKSRMDLLAPDVLEGLASILTYGATKYEPRNWEKGMHWGRVYAAAFRHLLAFWNGEDLDSESGLPHIDHALCCIMFLSAYHKRRIGIDDRSQLSNFKG